METEIEVKFPDVDIDELRARLHREGASLEYPERLMRRKIFDFPDRGLYKMNGWARVRDEGDKITMSYKQLEDRSLHGTKEVNIVVDNFDKACAFLEVLGLETRSFQETKRETWTLGGAEVTIDTWPWAPPFIEIEGPTEFVVRDVSATLGYDWKDAMHGSVETVYQMHFDVSDAEIDSWEEITFVPVPEWLEAKRKQ